MYHDNVMLIMIRSIKPKGMISLNQYTDNSSSVRNTSFQPSTKYSLFGPNNDGSTKREVKTVTEEGIYEELDGEKEMHKAKRVSGTKRSALITGGPNDYYNTLQFQEP